jgi:hypothetical protein
MHQLCKDLLRIGRLFLIIPSSLLSNDYHGNQVVHNQIMEMHGESKPTSDAGNLRVLHANAAALRRW